MTFVSLTRLRIRSFRFLPLFAVHAFRSLRQVRKAHGFRVGALLPDRDWTYWTMTAWESQDAMRQYMLSGAHKRAMPRLMHWCNEASVAHWEQTEEVLPTWEEADQRMRQSGRVSKVLHPASKGNSLEYRTPRTTGGTVVRRP